MVPSQRFSQMSLNGQNLWRNMSSRDRSLILGQDSQTVSTPSTLTDSPSDRSGGDDGGRGRGSFSKHRDKHGEPPTSFDKSMAPTDTDATSGTDDRLAAMCDHLGVSIDTLYAHVARNQSSRRQASLPSSRHANAAILTYSAMMARSEDNAASNDADLTYAVSASRHASSGALIDRGANGGIAGTDCTVHEQPTPTRYVNVEGIDNHVMEKRPIVTASAVAKSNRGPVLLIMHNYALAGKGSTIHSSGQMEWHKISVDDKSVKVGGTQCIETPDGFVLPLDVRRGLPYLDMRPSTEDDWDSLPHVLLTREEDWNPSVLDNDLSDDLTWYDAQPDAPLLFPLFDEHGELRDRIIAQAHATSPAPDHGEPIGNDEFLDAYEVLPDDDLESSLDRCVVHANLHRYVATLDAHDDDDGDSDVLRFGPKHVTPSSHDFALLRPRFGFLPTDIIRKTFAKTTQYARMPFSTVLKKRFRSPNPALNVLCRNKPVATDTIQSDTPAVDGGETYAQLFVGVQSLLSDAYGMKSPAQFPGRLENILPLTQCKN